MARPREFDENAVLETAMQCFWARGYQATSMRDLAEHMSMTGASLYNAFGDKRNLYGRALDLYVEHSFGARAARLGHGVAPRQAIGAFFDEIVARSLEDDQHKGCMLVNSAMEVAPHDPEFQLVIADVLVRVEQFFLRCLQAGQADGTITATLSADDMARLLLSTLLGIRVLARVRPERALLEGLVRPVYALLDGSAATPRRSSSRSSVRRHLPAQ